MKLNNKSRANPFAYYHDWFHSKKKLVNFKSKNSSIDANDLIRYYYESTTGRSWCGRVVAYKWMTCYSLLTLGLKYTEKANAFSFAYMEAIFPNLPEELEVINTDET
jgi:hypothetical protein